MKHAAKDLPGLKALDADRIEQELGVTMRINERLETGADKAECDAAFANDLAAHLGQASQEALKLVKGKLVYHHEQAARACAGLDFERQKHEIEAIQSEIRVAIESDRDDLSYTYDQYVGAKTHFDQYRKKRGLVAPAKPSEGLLNTGLFLTVLICLEAFFNALFLAPVDPQGLLWGSFSALILAIIGVLAGFSAGYWGKYINSRSWGPKLFGAVILAGGISCLLAFHYLVMKYRSEMSLLGEQVEFGSDYISHSELLSRTFNSISHTPLHVNDFNSLIIFIMGLMLGFLSLLKGYGLGDRYPGYTHQRKLFDDVREQYVSERKGHLSDLEALRQNAIDSIHSFINDAENGQKLATNYANASLELVQAHRTFEQSVHSTLRHLTSRYAESLPTREKAKVRRMIEERVSPAIEHSEDLQSLADEIRRIAQSGADDAERACLDADKLRERTIAAIDAQISEFRKRFADAT